jgi:hypothetical protein
MDKFWQNNIFIKPYNKKKLKHQYNQYNDIKDIEKLQI